MSIANHTTDVLRFARISKAFPGVQALQEVSFAVRAGEVRALMGANGAGKSTLLKILSGEIAADSGELIINGRAQQFSEPRDSAAAGIAIIHQELQLAPNLSVAENLFLGALPQRFGFIDGAALRAQARTILQRLGEDIDPDARVETLPIGKRQMIEIGKALLKDAKLIAFDEPTSSLSSRETATLMRIIRELRAQGRAILYVSHRMEEVFQLADGVTVLRDGRHLADWLDMRELDRDQLIAAMAGRTLNDIYDYQPRTHGAVTLTVNALLGPGLRAPVSLQAHQGEIVGLFGLVGAGRSELFKLLFGAVQADSGNITLHGRPLQLNSPRAAIAQGIALCPEDRKGEGIVPLASVRENIMLALRNLIGNRLHFIERRQEQQQSEALVTRMKVKTASLDTAVATLSGGNQQKTVIARWLAAGSRILLLDEPTRGIDVGARSEIYRHIYQLAEQGCTVLLASSDIEEVLGVSDRIVVMREGRIAGDVVRADATPEKLLSLAFPDAAQPATAAAHHAI